MFKFEFDSRTVSTHPSILRPHFLQFLENSFEKSGLRKVVLQTRICFQGGEKYFCKLGFFSGSRKVVDQKKNPSL